MTAAATVTKVKLASIQVCVPSGWTDEQVVSFADSKQPTGLDHGWSIRKQGDPALQGDPERNICRQNKDMVHIVLDC
jgi:hypothetical protein